ncbi:MAG: metallophosphoesterase [Kofleriaceae bacterium]
MKYVLFALITACTTPGDQRARAELDVGHEAFGGTTIDVTEGLAAVRGLGTRTVELWCNAPAIDVTLVAEDAGDWTIVASNSLVDAVLVVDGATVTREPGERTTVATFRVALAVGTHQLRIAPPDADVVEPFRAVAMADIQTALPIVDDVFEKISEVPGARFVVAMGDITERGNLDEYELFDKQLLTLSIPYYTTLGNHELWGPAERFFRYGRPSEHFTFKGTAFTFVDSGDAGIDPLVEEWLDGWLAESIDQPHVFLTHIPPIDPLGIRYGSFRSTRDAHRLLERLVEGRVDLTLYGHIHTLIEFENAGIPAFVSGGGGAQPMKGDGIDRHFLVIDFDGPLQTVNVVRVD